MSRSAHTEAQIIGAVKQVEAGPTRVVVCSVERIRGEGHKLAVQEEEIRLLLQTPKHILLIPQVSSGEPLRLDHDQSQQEI